MSSCILILGNKFKPFFSLSIEVFQYWDYWHLGPDNSSLWELPCDWRMFNTIIGPYFLDASSSALHSCDNPEMAQYPLEVNSPPVEND